MFVTDGDVRLVFLYNYIYLMRAFSRQPIIGCVGPICCLAGPGQLSFIYYLPSEECGVMTKWAADMAPLLQISGRRAGQTGGDSQN